MRNQRTLFNDHVAVLIQRLGLRSEEFEVPQAGRLLEGARERRLNDHEAALVVAYGLIPEVLHRDLERGRVLIDRLELMADAWRDEDLVKGVLPRELNRAARQALRQADE